MPTLSSQLHCNELGRLLSQHPIPSGLSWCLQNVLFCYAGVLEAGNVKVELGNGSCDCLVGYYQLQRSRPLWLLIVVVRHN